MKNRVNPKRMSRRRTLLLFLLISSSYLSVACAFASGIFDLGERHFERPGDHRAISGGIVSAIAQDEQGFIWIGGQQGAMRYDGYQFKLYKNDANNPNSIAGNYIQSLWAAPDGKLWFGTYGDGLSVLTPETQQFHNILLTDETEDFSRNSIQNIVGESPQRVWIATNGGISYINPETEAITHISHIQDCDGVYLQQSIRTMALDEQQGLWIASQNGLCRVNLPAKGEGHTRLIGKSYPQLSGYGINELLFVGADSLWLGTLQNGLARLNTSNSQLDWLQGADPELAHSWIISIAKVNEHQVWLGTLDNGIAIIEIDTFEVSQRIQHDEGLSGTISLDNIGAIFKDRTGLIWVGTWGAGLNLFAPNADSIRTLRHSNQKPDSIKPAKIRAITETHTGDIWIGYNQAGISIVSPASGEITHIEEQADTPGGLRSGDILALQHTHNGEVWVGTRNGGLFRFDPNNKQFVSYEQLIDKGLKTITGFTIENDETLWIATTRGMWHADLNSKQVSDIKDFSDSDGLTQKVVYSSTWQKPDSIWIGTDQGLYHLSSSQKQVTLLHPQEENTVSLSDNAINTVITDRNNQLWVGTEGGLDKLTAFNGEAAQFISIYDELGLPGEYTENMQIDDMGRIWYYRGVIDMTNQTLVHLDTLDAWSIGTIWLGSDLKTSDNKIIYGGTNGLLLIDPERYQPQQEFFAPVATRIQIDNQEVFQGPEETLTLTPENQVFSTEFSALDFIHQQDIRYAWCLKGFDSEWHMGDDTVRRATYTNLPSGEYQFMVKYQLHEQQWSSEHRLLSIKVLPAWYETIFARLVFLLLVLCFMWGLFSIRTRQLVQQKQKLDAQILKQTKELRQTNLDKDRIMSVLAHDINNKITINMGYLDLLKLSIDRASGDELQSYVDKALQNGQDCSELVAELRDYGKLSSESNDIPLERSNIVSATQKVIELHMPTALKKGLTIQFEAKTDKLYCQLDQSKFSRILENLLSNAIKFSDANREIRVSLNKSSGSVVMSVADKGIGIPQEIQDKLFTDFINTGRPGTHNEKSSGLGLYIVKKLVEQHHGRLWFTSEEGQGTTFYVEFPAL